MKRKGVVPKSKKIKQKSTNSSRKGALTPKQRLFCLEYLKDLNATQAAIRAGYSKKTAKEIGCENLTKPNIQAYCQLRMNKRAEKLKISSEYVLNNIVEIGERCMQRVPVMIRDGKTWKQKTEFNDDGKEVGVWEFKEHGALRAQELLGKHLNLFRESDEDERNRPVVVMPPIIIDGKTFLPKIGDNAK